MSSLVTGQDMIHYSAWEEIEPNNELHPKSRKSAAFETEI
jgi:hypothetical protein